MGISEKAAREENGFLAVCVNSCHCELVRAHRLRSFRTVAMRFFNFTSFRTGYFRLYREGLGGERAGEKTG